jgi:hypothetical protein
MMVESPPERPDAGNEGPPCPLCGSGHKLPPGKCPSCGREIIPSVGFSFSLTTLVMAVTVCAVISAAATLAIWLAALLAAMCVMAFFHCRCAINLRQNRMGRAMTPTERIAAFLESLLFAYAPFFVAGFVFTAVNVVGLLIRAFYELSAKPFTMPNPTVIERVVFWSITIGAIFGFFAFIGATILIWPTTRFRRSRSKTRA